MGFLMNECNFVVVYCIKMDIHMYVIAKLQHSLINHYENWHTNVFVMEKVLYYFYC